MTRQSRNGYVVIPVAAADADLLATALWSLTGVCGIEELPADGRPHFAVDPSFGVVEYGTEAARRLGRWLARDSFRGTGEIRLKVYLTVASAGAFRRWVAGFAAAHPALQIIEQGLLVSQDYTAAFRKRYRGRRVGRRLWVGPPWESPPAGRMAIIIEPGMAFGTGGHPTTWLGLEALERLAGEGWAPRRALDIGTGSGVLSIAAAKLFPGCELWLCDLDPLCAENAERNFAWNGLAGRPRKTFWGEAARWERMAAPARRFDLVQSNLYVEPLKSLVAPVNRLLRAGGRWIAGGLREEDQREFQGACRGRFRCVRSAAASEPRASLDARGGLRPAPLRWVTMELEPAKKRRSPATS